MYQKQALTLLQSFLSEVLPNLMLDITVEVTESSSSNHELWHAEFSGPDVARLTDQNGVLLLALEHLAAMSLRLQPGQHELLNFDAAGFKAARARKVEEQVRTALTKARSSDPVHHCAPMSYRERYMLHRSMVGTGVRSRLVGEGADRHLVLYFSRPRPMASTPEYASAS